jgi:hypothetical protein
MSAAVASSGGGPPPPFRYQRQGRESVGWQEDKQPVTETVTYSGLSTSSIKRCTTPDHEDGRETKRAGRSNSGKNQPKDKLVLPNNKKKVRKVQVKKEDGMIVSRL